MPLALDQLKSTEKSAGKQNMIERIKETTKKVNGIKNQFKNLLSTKKEMYIWKFKHQGR